jgi:hypothetical protein
MEAFLDRNQIHLARTRSHHDPHLQERFPAALKEKDLQENVPRSIKRTFSCLKKILLTKQILFVINLFGRNMGKPRTEN